MWCGKCQSDVVTELAADNRRVICATCRSALGEAAASQTEPANQRNSRAQEARELLNRWANGRQTDPFGPPRKRTFDDVLQPTPTITPTAEAPRVEPVRSPAPEPVVAETTPSTAAPESRLNDAAMNAELDRLTNEILARVEKFSRESPRASSNDDASASLPVTTITEQPIAAHEPTAAVVPVQSAVEPAPTTHRIEAAAVRVPDAHLPSPTNPPLQAPTEPATLQSSASPLHWVATARKNFGVMSNVGQGLSYVGILGITLGLSLVVLGTFGGSSHLAPTGWLIATLGQMLLLLGVVTSVTVGMEQSSAEMRLLVDERMRVLSEQIEQLRQRPTRVDQPHSSARAPHFANAPQRSKAASTAE